MKNEIEGLKNAIKIYMNMLKDQENKLKEII